MPIKIKSPKSYFFTDPTRISQVEAQAFGPVPGSQSTLEKKFNLTNLFTKTGTDNLGAFAVTDGVLFIVPQKDDINLVNVFLKPSTPVDIGIKIKYYAYRSIRREDLFIVNGTSFELLPQNTSNIIPFLNGIWKEFNEFNGSSGTGTNISFDANKIGFSAAQLNDYKAFFTKDQYTLPKIKIGDQIGNFDLEFGFEVIVDEGDFSQERSDMGFEFQDGFFRAKKCILNLNGDNATTDYGNIPTTVSEKVFRESIYLFLDPAAYYGSHITDLRNNNNNGGRITIKETTTVPEKTATEIYNKIVSKFINKNKTYLYIKSFRGRSYNFYTSNNFPITISNSGTNQNIFNENLWPFRVLESNFTPLKLRLNIFNQNCILYCNNGNSDFEFYDKKQLLSEDGTLAKEISFYLPKAQIEKVASIIYLTYDSGKDLFSDNLFGPINVDSIFEVEDSSNEQKISWVNHLRTIITLDGENINAYNTKIVIDSTSNVSEKILKTLYITPVANNIENNQLTELDQKKTTQAGYLTKSINNSQEFCFETLGIRAEIWKGQIKDGSQTINSLALRRDENIDAIPTFTLGITKSDYEKLENRISNILEATNIYINISNNLANDASSLQFAKYALQLTYDNKLGEKTTTITPASQTEIYLYTVDGLFYFTSLYSFNFKFFSEFAKVTVDFRPRNDWMQYYKYKNNGTTTSPIIVTDGLYNDTNVFYGFDWLRKGDSERTNLYRISDETSNAFYQIIGDNTSTDPNSNTVTPNKKKYISVKGFYRVIPVSWKLPNGDLFDSSENYTNKEPDNDFDKDYAPSWISIPQIPNNTIQLIKQRLKIRCKQKPSILKLYFNAAIFKINKIGNSLNPLVQQDQYYINDKISYVEIGSSDIPPDNSIKWLDFEFEVINPNNRLEIFKILEGNNLAGKLYITPNTSDSFRYKKLLIVKVKHNASAAGEVDTDELKILNVFSSHANIKLKIEDYQNVNNINELDLSSDSDFQQYFVSGKIDRAKLVNGKTIYKYLLDKINGYEEYVKIFTINAGAKSFGLGGATIEDMKVVIMFSSPMEGTSPNIYHLAHEYLHSIGVAHTFTDKLIDKNAFLTFKEGKTNNVMDYNNDEIALHQFVQGTFFWQWAIARQNSSKNF